MKAGTKSRLTG